MLTTVFDVADYFLARNSPATQEDRITPLKLQKLVYYAQGYALAIQGRSLFDETITAWDSGPVCVDLYHRFKDFVDSPIDTIHETDEAAAKALKAAQKSFNQEEINLLEDVFFCYKGFTLWELSLMTHETEPWEKAFPDRQITIESMRKFFRGRIDTVKAKILPLTSEEADKIAESLGVYPPPLNDSLLIF